MTPKAFAILRYLVDKAGRLVSQRELLDALWPDTFVQPEVLKTHILDVRNTLGDSAKNPKYIETLPRRGYRFIAKVRQTSADGLSQQKSPVWVVGREQELNQLQTSLAKAKAGERQIVFVAGEVGIGKTTLIDAFAEQASGHVALRVIRGQCIEGSGPQEPYFPVLEALGQLLRSEEGNAIADMLAAQAPTLMVQFPALLKPDHREMLQRELVGATKERMLREICEALETIAAEKTLVLLLEDIHWADSSTVDLLAVMARGRNRAQLMLVATYRPEQAAMVQHALLPVKQRLLVHHLCEELLVGPLTEQQVEEFLKTKAHGAALPEGLTHLIFRHSEGNPLFLTAVLDHLSARGLLTKEKDFWRLTVPLSQIEMEVPENLRQMLEMDISRGLSEEEQRALEAASVSGISFLAEVSASAAEMKPERLEELCDMLAHRGQLVRSMGLLELPEGTVTHKYRFVHALYHEVFYRRIAAGRRARLHKRTAESLELHFKAELREAAAKLALHFEEGFDWPKAIRYLLLAAENEGKRFAYREALPVLEHALELVTKLPEAERVKVERDILLKLGAFYFSADDIPRAIRTFESLAQQAVMRQDAATEVLALTQLLFPLSRISADRALQVSDHLLELSNQIKDRARRIHAEMTALFWRIMAWQWSSSDAKKHQAMLAEFPPETQQLILAGRMGERACIEWLAAQYQNGLRSMEASLGAMIDTANIGHRGALVIQVFLLLYAGEWGKGLKVVKRLVDTSRKNESHQREYALRILEAWFYLWAADFKTSLEICEEALPKLTSAGAGFFRETASIIAGSATCGLGYLVRAQKHLIQAGEEPPALLHWYWKMPLEKAWSELAIKQGDLAAAREHAQRFLELSLATAERTWQALAWEVNARIALLEHDQAGAEESITNALKAMDGFDLPLAAGPVHCTAMKVFPQAAEHHRKLAAQAVLRLANSLNGFDNLRKIFLHSEVAKAVLPEERSGAA